MTPKYSWSQRAFAECFGTAALVLVGSGSVIAMANPRLVEEPVIEAVSHEDPITADSRQQP